MNRIVATSIAAVLMSMTFGASAMDDKDTMDMKAMDTNHDGMISKSEFMKYHEAMWAKMKKNKKAWWT